MTKFKRWLMGKRPVAWSEPELPKYVKINPLSPPGAAEGVQPGDFSMLRIAEEFLEDAEEFVEAPEEGMALPDVEPGDGAPDEHPLDLRRALEDREDHGLRGSLYRPAACGPRGISTDSARAVRDESRFRADPNATGVRGADAPSPRTRAARKLEGALGVAVSAGQTMQVHLRYFRALTCTYTDSRVPVRAGDGARTGRTWSGRPGMPEPRGWPLSRRRGGPVGLTWPIARPVVVRDGGRSGIAASDGYGGFDPTSNRPNHSEPSRREMTSRATGIRQSTR